MIEYQRVLPVRKPNTVLRTWGWQEVVTDLVEGRSLFVSDEFIQHPRKQLKYLRLALSTRRAEKGLDRYSLHAEPAELEGELGWALSASPMDEVPETTPMPVTEIA